MNVTHPPGSGNTSDNDSEQLGHTNRLLTDLLVLKSSSNALAIKKK